MNNYYRRNIFSWNLVVNVNFEKDKMIKSWTLIKNKKKQGKKPKHYQAKLRRKKQESCSSMRISIIIIMQIRFQEAIHMRIYSGFMVALVRILSRLNSLGWPFWPKWGKKLKSWSISIEYTKFIVILTGFFYDFTKKNIEIQIYVYVPECQY